MSCRTPRVIIWSGSEFQKGQLKYPVLRVKKMSEEKKMGSHFTTLRNFETGSEKRKERYEDNIKNKNKSLNVELNSKKGLKICVIT